jgi:predicted metal-binding protein
VAECRQLFSEFLRGYLLRFEVKVDDPEDRHAETRKINLRLLKVERELFLKGYYKALMLFVDPCNVCVECPDETGGCHSRELARPSPEALAVDLFTTARNLDLPLEVLRTYDETMNRYALVLVE